eukprot:CAMPEP_0202487050 /NCGR_PEP_ID=MMETSP1361-20130828/5480_1 /ASSEMBLY_ACC=CAM_ASM_000849 /TAXON_ID=210615 /ORGANISM="Staurosira complex sp., Strain CCMP2646" /LENGTH=148 /DNA_ID=CAMNT_0049116351 /DNA_START=412 /DNA_END=860 /DNA_ORIENTATION=-
MIAKARQQFPHLQLIQTDIYQFDLEEPVDVIFSNAALHWVGNENNAAEATDGGFMARALKPGGRFVVEFGGKGNVITGGPASIANIGLPWYIPSIAEYTTVLESHGIELTMALLFDRPAILEGGEEELRDWLDMFGNKFFEKMSKDEI